MGQLDPLDSAVISDRLDQLALLARKVQPEQWGLLGFLVHLVP